MNYCPLNIFSEYSFLKSSLKVEEIFEYAKKYHYPSFATCDYSLCAYENLYQLEDKYNLKPLYGASIDILYLDEHPLRISLYITSETGYKNLIKLVSLNRVVSIGELNKHKEGLIIIIPFYCNKQLIFDLDNNFEYFKNELFRIVKGFDESYLGIEIYARGDYVNAEKIREFAKQYSYKTVAFNAHYYANKIDAIKIEILSAIENNTKLDHYVSEGPFFFLKENAIRQIYHQEEIDASYEIYTKCKDFKFFKKRGNIFKFPFDVKEKLVSYCLDSLKKKNINEEKYLNRLNYEISMIENLGFLDYFLIVQDYVLFAKKNNILVGPGRGSACGSLVSYLLDITEIDPLKYDLYFERFLNPERSSYPDIDVDFDALKKEKVIEYIQKKYGYDKTCFIITYQQFGPKAALRDIQNIFNFDSRDINTISRSLKRYESFKEAYKYSSAFRDLTKDDYYLRIIKLANAIEGLPRQRGVHPAGIIINNENIDDTLAYFKEDDKLIVHLSKDAVEQLGFLKMDILSLSNLSIIDQMVKYINHYEDKNFNLKNIPLNDFETFKILNNGLTSGIFQLDSSGITKALNTINVSSFSDIIALLALYRPGPMDNIPLYAYNKMHPEQIKYIHPDIEDILKPTNGVIIYQEQIMALVRKIASFSLAKADLFRKAISKKNEEKLISLKDEFISGAVNNHLSKDIAEELFELILKFANYGFNKAHSVAYALITYQMAYIKAHYPASFYACNLNQTSLNDTKGQYLKNEMKHFSLSLNLPDINKSKNLYIIEDKKLYIPFTQIKGLSSKTIAAIKDLQKQEITSFEQFLELIFDYKIDEKDILNLINAGCFDNFEYNRMTLRKYLPIYLEFFNSFSDTTLTKEELDGFKPFIEVQDEDLFAKYNLEEEVLGIILSGSIFDIYKEKLQSLNIKSIKESSQSENEVTIAAIVLDIKRIKTKKNEDMAFLRIKDDSMEVNCTIFPELYKESLYTLLNNNLLLISGKFIIRNDELSIIAQKIEKLN